MIIFHFSQFIDRPNDIGDQWNRFKKAKSFQKSINPVKCSAKSIAIKVFVVSIIAFLVYFVSLGELYREKVLSAISTSNLDAKSAFNFGTTVNTYFTLSCNVTNENELQCLVHVQPHIPETKNCYTSHGTVNNSFCGRLRWCNG